MGKLLIPRGSNNLEEENKVQTGGINTGKRN